MALIPAFAVGRSQEVLGLVAHHARQNPDLTYRVYLDGLTRAVTACYDRFAEELTGQYRELRRWIDYRLIPVADRVDRDTLVREEILGRPGVIIASSGMLKKGSLSYQYALHLAGDPKNAIFYSGYLAEDSEAVDFLQGTVDDLVDAGIEVRCEQRRFYFSAHAPKEDLVQFVFDVRPRAVILIHGDADKRTQVPDNLFTLLKQMESDSFQVFIGQENHPIKYREGKFYQE
ncbi:MAG: hypothetical protein HC875_36785 [Anaerolineales bacterium]|nr:hypothetical protein [Anaerolineales bacterium]